MDLLKDVSMLPMIADKNPTWLAEAKARRGGLALEELNRRVLMTGSRTWTDRASIEKSLKRALSLLGLNPTEATLIHGAAKGADLMAAAVAEELGMATEAHPAQWNVHNVDCPTEPPVGNTCWQGKETCKRAGFRRNREMIDSGAAILLAFIHDESAGAGGTLKIWQSSGKPAIICRQKGSGEISVEIMGD